MCTAVEEYGKKCEIRGREEGKEEGRKEGRVEGKEEGRLQGKILAYFDMGVTLEDIAKKLNINFTCVKDVIEGK